MSLLELLLELINRFDLIAGMHRSQPALEETQPVTGCAVFAAGSSVTWHLLSYYCGNAMWVERPHVNVVPARPESQ